MSDTGSPSFDAAIREIARLNAIVKAYEDGGKISAHLTAQSVKDHAKTNGELIRLRAINVELVAALEETLPRYVALFEAAGRNPADSVAVGLIEAVLAKAKEQT